MTKPLYGLEQSWEWSWWCLGSSESRALHTRPAPFYKIETFLFMNPTASHFFFWVQGLPCQYLSCWSFRDGLMPRLSSVLTTSTWVSNVKSVSLDIQKWTDKSLELHFFATMKQPVRLCLTECIQTKVIDQSNTLPGPNKQTKVTIEGLAIEHCQTRRKKNKKQRNKTKVIIKHLSMSKETNKKRDYRTPCHRAQPHAERSLELSVRWCPVRPAAAPQPPWGVGILYFDTENLISRRKKDVGPGVPVPTGQVQGGVRVDHRSVRRVLPHLGRVDNQYPGDVQKIREKN